MEKEKKGKIRGGIFFFFFSDWPSKFVFSSAQIKLRTSSHAKPAFFSPNHTSRLTLTPIIHYGVSK